MADEEWGQYEKKDWVEEVGEKKMVAGLISSPVKINVVDYLGSQWGGPQGSLKSSPWGSLESGGSVFSTLPPPCNHNPHTSLQPG